MPKIDALYAWVVADAGPDDEGIPAIDGGPCGYPGYVMPLMGADSERAQSLEHGAQMVANKIGKPVKLIRSTGIEVVRVIGPKL